jgi:glycosyltransferase involved in cell wall biosynthesis
VLEVGFLKTPLVINYLLEDTALFGGVKVPIHQANLLTARGHRVTVVSKGERPNWYGISADFRKVESFDASELPRADVTVATFWTTIRPAASITFGSAVHYCQGFEATHLHNVKEHPAILEAYRTPMPCIAVSPHLAALVRERFGRPARVVPPALAPYWRPGLRRRPHSLPRVVVVNPFEIEWKGVATGLRAVAELRQRGVACRLVRLSQWPLSDDERSLFAPDEFHHHLEPLAVARLFRGADLMLAPSWEQEGFGLPVLEAMACGVPVVASDISAFRAFAGSAAALVPYDRPEVFAEAAGEILANPARWRAMRRRGLEASRQFTEEQVARIAEEAFYWVAGRRWRSEQ